MHGRLESAPDRDRSARQRKDEPAPARRGRGAPGRRAGGALLPGRLRGRELRGRHRGRVLAGVPDATGRPGGPVSGRRTRPRPHRRRAARRPGRPRSGRSLSRRAAGLRGPARPTPPADGGEPEHVVQGRGRPGRGVAAAEGPPDRAADHPVRERDQPVRRDRPARPRPVRHVPGPHAAPARHGSMRRALGGGGRPPRRARNGPFAGDPHRRQSAVDRHRRPLRRRPFLPRADGRPARPGRRPHGVLQEPPGIASRAGAPRLSRARRAVEAGHDAGSRGPRPARAQPVQRPARAPPRARRGPGSGRQRQTQAVLPDRAPVQRLLPAAPPKRPRPSGRSPRPLHGVVLFAAGAEGHLRSHGQRGRRDGRGGAIVAPDRARTVDGIARPGRGSC